VTCGWLMLLWWACGQCGVGWCTWCTRGYGMWQRKGALWCLGPRCKGDVILGRVNAGICVGQSSMVGLSLFEWCDAWYMGVKRVEGTERLLYEQAAHRTV
jgi:hypothetical protein